MATGCRRDSMPDQTSWMEIQCLGICCSLSASQPLPASLFGRLGVVVRRASVRLLERSTMEQGFVPGAAQREVVFFVMGFVSIVFGTALLFSPMRPPFTGRGSNVASLLYAWFGIWDMPVFCWLAAVAALAVALFLRQKRLRVQHCCSAR
jgi:hypothetical protein